MSRYETKKLTGGEAARLRDTGGDTDGMDHLPLDRL